MDITEIEHDLKLIAKQLDSLFPQIWGQRMGFCLMVFDFDTPSMMNYISNGQRKDMIEALKEAVAKLEKNLDIGPTFSTKN